MKIENKTHRVMAQFIATTLLDLFTAIIVISGTKIHVRPVKICFS